MSVTLTKKITRRRAVQVTGKALISAAGLNALATSSAGEGRSNAATASSPDTTNASPAQKLRIATCQFPVSGNPAENVQYVRDFMHQAAAQGAHLLHTSEASFSGYPGCDLPSFQGYDWDALRQETSEMRALAKELNLWLVLGSAHYLDANNKPTNCQYLIDPQGKIVDRYDKCFLTGGDQKHYSAGNRLVTHEIRGVKVGLGICYDICFPQHYIAYRRSGVTLMIHSFSNARSKAANCLET